MTQERVERENVRIARRAVLKAAGASAALGLGTGAATAQSGGQGGDPGGSTEANGDASNSNDIDPIFGKAVAGGNPCADLGAGGSSTEDCFGEFRPPIRPSGEIELHIDLPEILLAVAGRGGLSDETTGSINRAVADGSVVGDDDTLHLPDAPVTIRRPGGGRENVTVREIAGAAAGMVGFHFDPAGFRVRPGDVVLFSAETPDHAVAAYHERHGRQNRVPDGVGPIASPLVPVGGYWLYQFEREGVYDLYCPPHQVFGMVMRIVVYDGEGDVPTVEESVDSGTGRPPQGENLIASVLGGLDPNLPSSAEALATDALAPDNIVTDGPVSWEDVVAEHRSG